MSNHHHDHSDHNDDGFTIVEMAVVVLLLGLVSFVMLNFLNSTLSTTTRASRDNQAEQNMTIALRTISQDIRSASSVTACASATYKTCLVLDIPRNAAVGLTCPGRTITYQFVSGQVKQTQVDYPANACSPTTTKFSARPLLENVVNGASDAFFTFYDKTGVAFDPDTTPAKLVDTGSIKTLVKVDYKVSGSSPISLSSVAALRNQR